jgi:hypothetical protein
VQLVLQDLKELLDLKALQVLRVQQVLKVLQDFKALLVQQEQEIPIGNQIQDMSFSEQIFLHFSAKEHLHILVMLFLLA